jgi:hypothetical protein
MAFDWPRLLLIARELADRADEASHRTAVNRAYYAAYGTARVRLVREEGPIPLGVNTHDYVWRAYFRSRDRLRRFIGKGGYDLLRLRVQADYADDISTLDLDAGTAVILAERTLANLASLE